MGGTPGVGADATSPALLSPWRSREYNSTAAVASDTRRSRFPPYRPAAHATKAPAKVLMSPRLEIFLELPNTASMNPLGLSPGVSSFLLICSSAPSAVRRFCGFRSRKMRRLPNWSLQILYVEPAPAGAYTRRDLMETVCAGRNAGQASPTRERCLVSTPGCSLSERRRP